VNSGGGGENRFTQLSSWLGKLSRPLSTASVIPLGMPALCSHMLPLMDRECVIKLKSGETLVRVELKPRRIWAGASFHCGLCVRRSDCRFSLALPPPPAEQTTAGEDYTRNAGSCDWTGNGGSSGQSDGAALKSTNVIPVSPDHI
jgi:hypothetical protein